jgi:hypothetical protein
VECLLDTDCAVLKKVGIFLGGDNFNLYALIAVSPEKETRLRRKDNESVGH